MKIVTHRVLIDYFKANFNLELKDDDIEDMFSVIDRYRMPDLYNVTMNEVLRVVSIYTGITFQQMRSRNRLRTVVMARYLFYYILKNHTKYTLVAMGQLLNQHHTSVLHGLNFMSDMISIGDKKIMSDISDIELKIIENENKKELKAINGINAITPLIFGRQIEQVTF